MLVSSFIDIFQTTLLFVPNEFGEDLVILLAKDCGLLEETLQSQPLSPLPLV